MQNEIIVNGIKVLVQRKKVKRVTLKCDKQQGAHVVCPLNFSQSELVKFLNEKVGWLEKQLNGLRLENELKYETGETHYLWGKPYELKVFSGDYDIAFYKDGAIYLVIKSNYDKDKRREIMEKFYKKQVELKAPERFEFWKGQTGFEGKFVGVKNTKRQLGCCKTHLKEITLSLELAKYAPLCLDYVICHELCHTKISGHSKEFHNLEKKVFPKIKDAKKLLRQ